MPKEDWDVLTLREETTGEVRRLREELRSVGTASLPADLQAVAGKLSLSDVVTMGVRAVRSRMKRPGLRRTKGADA